MMNMINVLTYLHNSDIIIKLFILLFELIDPVYLFKSYDVKFSLYY